MLSEYELTDMARELLCAAAKEGSAINFHDNRPVVDICSVYVGDEIRLRQIEHRTYLEYKKAADELVERDYATEESGFPDGLAHVYELTIEGYHTAGLISRAGE